VDREGRERVGDEARLSRTRVAVLVPCFNEVATVAAVVRDFKAALPGAEVFVFDNNSSDATASEAAAAGATVVREPRQGKGFVVQSMFRTVDADLYVMVDGDGTYPAEAAPMLIEPAIRGEADMVVGSRLVAGTRSEFHPLNRFGNKLLRALLNLAFRVRLTDVLSGYRVFSRRLVRALPLAGGGFEVEVELTIKALQRGFAIREAPVNLRRRPAGSDSKIRIVRDGLAIGWTILSLFRDYKPLTFFGGLGLVLVLGGAAPGGMLLLDVARTGAQPPLALAVISAGLLAAGAALTLVGLVLHAIARRFQELEVMLERLQEDR
jgi:glycosyltransferase involved in cell wall biosynthesis